MRCWCARKGATMIGYLIDVENDKARVVDIDDNDHLGQFYRLIGCDCIDIAVRKVGGKPYNIVVDDEGFLKRGCKISGIDRHMGVMLAGSIILFGIGDDGDLASIGDADRLNIGQNVVELFDFDTMQTHPVVMMEY